MKTIYINKGDLKQTLEQITKQQIKNNIFVNVAVKPYRGKKYDPKTTVTIQIG